MRRTARSSLALAVLSVATVGSAVWAQPADPATGVVPAGRGSVAASEAKSVGMIAYAALGIYTIRTDGSYRTRLTSTGDRPAWSPDGTKIAFDREDEVWLMDASGGSQERLVEGSSPAWAPDGQRLTYWCHRARGLCLFDLQARTRTVLVADTEEWGVWGESTWSPDGSWIAFTRRISVPECSVQELALVRPDGQDLTPIPQTAEGAISPAWSPDGSTILYTQHSFCDHSGSIYEQLWSIHPDGSGSMPVIGASGAGAWSPDGHRMAVEGDTSMHPWKGGVWTMNADGTNRELVAYGSEPSWRPHFESAAAPDVPSPPASGRRIAYVAATDAGFDLFTVRPDGAHPRRLTTSGRLFQPAWSPDHTRIAYFRQGSLGVRLAITDVGSGKTRRHQIETFLPLSELDLAWAPDGRRIAWVDWYTSPELVKMNMRTREVSRHPVSGIPCCFVKDVSWSPDGDSIAFTAGGGRRDIWTVGVTGGEARRVARLRGTEEHVDWSPNGSRIAFTRTTDKAIALFSVRRDGTGLRRIINTPNFDLWPAWSSDGQRIAFYSDGPEPFGEAPRPGLWTVSRTGASAQLVVKDRSIAYVDW